MSEKKVVIIGSGLGGLACGVILAKNGYNVTVLEKERQVGGCLQCFVRKGAKFETGMHFIGSAKEGQTLNKLLNYLGVLPHVTLSQLDTDAYDIVALNGQTFEFANGREAFIKKMTDYFPKQKENLNAYFDLIEKVAGASSMHSLKYAEKENPINAQYQLVSINQIIDSIITDKLLADVLVGNLPLYAAEKDKTPFSTHAFIMDFYNQSAFRVVGGSDAIAESLCISLKSYGGKLFTNTMVTEILCDDSKAVAVKTKEGEIVSADYVISDAHPMRTLEMLKTNIIRPAFRNRINNVPQTVGGFSLYLEFKDKSVPYMNSNFYAYNSDSPWGCEYYDERSWPKGFLYMHLCHKENPEFAKTGVVLSYMQMKDVEKWTNTTVGKHGDDYERFKRKKAEKLIGALEHHFPGIRENIKNYYTSTPLTYRDYTGTENGSMYGVAKDINLGIAARIPHRLRVPNVYQTGQNINSHGILGVLVGAIVTCSEFLTAKTIYQQIVK